MIKAKNIFLLIFLITVLYSFFPVLNESIKHLNGILFIVCFFIFIYYSFITNKKYSFRKVDLKVYGFLIFWFCYSLASSVFTYNIKFGLVEAFRILVMLISFFITAQMLTSIDSVKKFSNFLTLIFFLYLLVALWEITTFNHLPSSHPGVDGIRTFIPYGPFYNRNDMAAVLLMLLPFPFFLMLKKKNILLKVIAFIFIILLGISITLAGARLAMIFYIICLATYLILYTSFKTKIISISALILIIIIINSWIPQYVEFFKLYLKDQVGSVGSENESYIEGSIKIRQNLILEGINLGIDSHFLGVGSGNIIATMARDSYKRTQNVLIPHNFLIEVFASYGLIITLWFLWILYTWLIELIKILIHKKGDPDLAKACLFSFILFLPASILPSSIMRYNFYWILFAFFHQFINLSKENLPNAGNAADPILEA